MSRFGHGNAACSPLWHATTGSNILAAPVVANGVVYVGSMDINVYAYPASCGTGGATCTSLWHATTGDDVTFPVAVADGTLYVPSVDGTLYAFTVGGDSP